MRSYKGVFKYLFLVATIILWIPTRGDSLQTHNKLWTNFTVTGSLINYEKILYDFEMELRLRDRGPTIFDQALPTAAIGYQINDRLSLWMGYTFFITNKSSKNNFYYEYRFWPQIIWDIVKKENGLRLSSRTRLELRKNTIYNPWTKRAREKLTLNIPFKNHKDYYYILADEIFFNLNRPSWVNTKPFDQNRVFIGVGIPILNKSIFEICYMNQYQTTNPRKMSHVLYLSFKL